MRGYEEGSGRDDYAVKGRKEDERWRRKRKKSEYFMIKFRRKVKNNIRKG